MFDRRGFGLRSRRGDRLEEAGAVVADMVQEGWWSRGKRSNRQGCRERKTETEGGGDGEGGEQ